MSTATKRLWKQAMDDAEEFRVRFSHDTYERWEIAGSIRRRKPEVGDVEHVIIPRIGNIPDAGLFGMEGDLLWHRLDELVNGGAVSKHYYGPTAPHRWGDTYRGVDFRGFNHEIFCATPDNWGAILAIRTGPSDFSRRLVTMLRRQGYRQDDGQTWYCDGCECERNPKCGKCDGTGLVKVRPIPVPDEQTYFKLCGLSYIDPMERR